MLPLRLQCLAIRPQRGQYLLTACDPVTRFRFGSISLKRRGAPGLSLAASVNCSRARVGVARSAFSKRIVHRLHRGHAVHLVAAHFQQRHLCEGAHRLGSSAARTPRPRHAPTASL